jgi:hypothetical protein
VAKAVGAGIDEPIPSAADTEPIRTAIGVSAEEFQSLCDAVTERLENTLSSYEP